jgi:hypothetical protein
VPGISCPGTPGIPVSFSTAGEHNSILFGKDLDESYRMLEELLED